MYHKLSGSSTSIRRANYFTMKNLTIVYLVLICQITFSAMAQTGNSIRFGDNLLDTVVCGSTDNFTFEADSGDVVVIHVVELNDFGGVCGPACFCFDQRIELLDAANNVVAVNSSPSGNNTQNRFRTQIGPERLPSSGTYKVAVRDKENNGRGEYSIFLQRINAPGRAEPISIGANLLVSLNRGEVDSYVFNASPQDRLGISMTPDALGNLQPRLALYNQQGQALALPGSGSIEYVFSSGGTFTLLAFSNVDESGSYRLSLSTVTAVAEVTTELPTVFALMDNYPNPFKPNTEISFQLPKASSVMVKVFNTLGQEIRTLIDMPYQAGYHKIHWDGKDKNGNQVESGVYLYQFTSGSFAQVKKMTLIR